MEVCGHCGDTGHSFDKCAKANQETNCENCKRFTGRHHRHQTNDKCCPTWTFEKIKIINQQQMTRRNEMSKSRGLKVGQIDILLIQEPYMYMAK